MPQHDFDIANQSAPNFRADLNNALEALGTLSSGATPPSNTYANMLWYDTTNNILKMRKEADDAWIDLFDFNQGAGTSFPSGVPQVIDEDNFASNSATRPPSQQSVGAFVNTLPVTEEYFSSAQTFVAGGSLTLSHGLSSQPKLIMGELHCVAAEGGYSVGDIVLLPPTSKPGGQNEYAFVPVVDATNITIRFGASGDGLLLLRKDNGSTLLLSNGSWNLYVRAFA